MGLAKIDLGFNRIAALEPRCFASLPNVVFLYLHGNLFPPDAATTPGKAAKGSVVGALEDLTQLKKLTLHGSPLAECQGYRFRLIMLLPWLKELDNVSIDAAERGEAPAAVGLADALGRSAGPKLSHVKEGMHKHRERVEASRAPVFAMKATVVLRGSPNKSRSRAT